MLVNKIKGLPFIGFLGVVFFLAIIVLLFVRLVPADSYNSNLLENDVEYIQDFKEKQVVFIQRDSSRFHNKAKLHLQSFVDSLKKVPSIKPAIYEGVGDNYVLLRKIVEDHVAKGAKFIFVVGFSYSVELSNIFRANPEVTFFLYGGASREPNVINFIPRTYHAKYIFGILAGLTTKTDKIGYVSDYKSSWNLRSINAFALGVQRVNQNAKIYLTFTNNSINKEKSKYIIEELLQKDNIDVITGSMESCLWCEVASKKDNVSFIGQMIDESDKYKEKYLSTYVYNMEPFYSYFMMAITNGLPNIKNRFWFGMKQGVINFKIIEDSMPKDIKDKVLDEFVKLHDGSNFVFRSPIYSNDHRRIATRNVVIPDSELVETFDWLNSNIQEVEIPVDAFNEINNNERVSESDSISYESLTLEKALEILENK